MADASQSRWRTAWRIAQVRLRLIAVLLLAFLIVGKWDLIKGFVEVYTRSATAPGNPQVVSSETEYFCPMCPGVISTWPSKCPVCNMALVRRQKGDMGPLPNGVVARMQLSPYRIQLAGIQTTAVTYSLLVYESVRLGQVKSAFNGPSPATKSEVHVELFESDLPMTIIGQRVDVRAEAHPSQVFAGTLAAIQSQPAAVGRQQEARVAVEDPQQQLQVGAWVNAKLQTPIAQTAMWRSANLERMQSLAILDGVSRALATWDLPEVAAGIPGILALVEAGTAQRSALVLSIPESAVIDTGLRRVVYVESEPGVFDGVEVALGPRCGGYYPVRGGLKAGQLVVTTGAFLLDAETQLNPSLAAGYFGANRASTQQKPAQGPTTPANDDARKAISELSAADRVLAERQKLCPVTGKPLGSMGIPVRVVVRNRIVFLCCDGCESALERNPDKYLSKLPD